MGHMPPHCFSNANNGDAKNKRNTKGGTWIWAMCPHILKKKLKPLVKSLGTKQSHKSSYTILEGPSEERCDERTKIETNVFWSKVTFVLRWKSSMKGGKSTSASGWRRRRTPVVSLERVASVLRINALITWTYSYTWTRACVWCKHANGGGTGSRVNSKHLWKVKANALIVCFSYNASQLPPMYRRKQVGVSWQPFSPPHGGKDKHQEKNNKKTCHVATSKRLDANWNKGICKARIYYNYVKPCVLNVEFEPFIPKFNKTSLLCGLHSKRG